MGQALLVISIENIIHRYIGKHDENNCSGIKEHVISRKKFKTWKNVKKCLDCPPNVNTVDEESVEKYNIYVGKYIHRRFKTHHLKHIICCILGEFEIE